jgi:hypothetical protein
MLDINVFKACITFVVVMIYGQSMRHTYNRRCAKIARRPSPTRSYYTDSHRPLSESGGQCQEAMLARFNPVEFYEDVPVGDMSGVLHRKSKGMVNDISAGACIREYRQCEYQCCREDMQ